MRLIAVLVFIMVFEQPFRASAWNIPGHMLSTAIAYQMLNQENPATEDCSRQVPNSSGYPTKGAGKVL
jgi:hypothetical protein